MDRTEASRLETGRRGKWLLEPEAIAGAAVQLGLARPHAHALAGLWQAAATPTGLAPRVRWSNNYYRQPGAPCWTWLRTSSATSGTVTDLWWGAAFQHSVLVEPGAGIIVQFPTNLPNPPFEVTFTGRGGWADFGEGVVPPEMAQALGVEMVDPRTLLSVQAPVDPEITAAESAVLRSLFGNLRDIAERLSVTWSILFPHLGMARSERTPVPLDGLQPEVTATAGEIRDANGALLTQLTTSRDQAARIREAAGLSQASAARLATMMDPTRPVHEDHVRRLETTGTVSSIPGFLSRLDMAYRADGRIGLEVVFDSGNTSTGPSHGGDEVCGEQVRARGLRRDPDHLRLAWDIHFPDYWVGHVWMQAISLGTRSRFGDVDLVWGDWRRLQKTRSGCVFTTRKSEPGQRPLRVTI